MQYLGGKSRLVRSFAPILDKSIERCEGRYIEPFVGGMNIIGHLPSARTAVLADCHAGLMAMYEALQAGWIPPSTVSEDEYASAKSAGGMDPRTVFISFACSFGGKEWGGYARCKRGYNYASGGKNSVLRKMPIAGVDLDMMACTYDQIPSATRPTTYYCDPPYLGTTGYRTGTFAHEDFYAWCEGLSAAGHTVYVSEFDAPIHWRTVWQRPRSILVNATSKTVRVDKLYRVP